MPRISRLQVGHALKLVNNVVSKLPAHTDEELFAWVKKIFPIISSTTREEAIIIIVKDVLYRAFEHMTDTYIAAPAANNPTQAVENDTMGA